MNQSQSNWAVIGASGWVGSNVVAKARKLGVDFEAFGSHDRIEEVAGLPTRIAKYDPDTLIKKRFDVIWDCAFITQEKLRSHPELTEVNRYLTQALSQVIKSNAFGKLVYFSSGASQHSALRAEAYGSQKREVENEILSLVSRNAEKVKICRLWNVSGPHCKKKRDFAITSMIYEALEKGTITISSTRLVWRRFAMLEQVAHLMLNLGSEIQVIDSGGPLVEIGDLAREIAKAVGDSITIIEQKREGTGPLYFSESLAYEANLIKLGVTPASMKQQVQFMLKDAKTNH